MPLRNHWKDRAGVNALAEEINTLYKTELIRELGQCPWKTVDDIELATLA